MTNEQKATEIDDERAAFEKSFPHIEFTPSRNSWGRSIYLHPHVQSLWDGWKARAALQKPVERVAVPCSNCDGKGGYGGQWMTHPESGPELVGEEKCDACSGTGEEYYKLVPEELTDRMLKATLAGIAEPQDFAQQHKLREYLRDNYRKQIAAAPSVEVAKT